MVTGDLDFTVILVKGNPPLLIRQGLPEPYWAIQCRPRLTYQSKTMKGSAYNFELIKKENKMSLLIDVSKVKEILLPDGNWYKVEGMYIDAYEFITYSPENNIVLDFQSDNKDDYTGFSAVLAEDNSVILSGPMSSIIATKEDAKKKTITLKL